MNVNLDIPNEMSVSWNWSARPLLYSNYLDLHPQPEIRKKKPRRFSSFNSANNSSGSGSPSNKASASKSWHPSSFVRTLWAKSQKEYTSKSIDLHPANQPKKKRNRSLWNIAFQYLYVRAKITKYGNSCVWCDFLECVNRPGYVVAVSFVLLEARVLVPGSPYYLHGPDHLLSLLYFLFDLDSRWNRMGLPDGDPCLPDVQPDDHPHSRWSLRATSCCARHLLYLRPRLLGDLLGIYQPECQGVRADLRPILCFPCLPNWTSTL